MAAVCHQLPFFGAQRHVVKTNDIQLHVNSSSIHPIDAPTKWMANAAIGSPTPADIVAYCHASLCSPTLSTLKKAIKNNYIRNFPGLTLKSLKKYSPRSIATAKGHMSQTLAL